MIIVYLEIYGLVDLLIHYHKESIIAVLYIYGLLDLFIHSHKEWLWNSRI